jgi:hypothetical protein
MSKKSTINNSVYDYQVHYPINGFTISLTRFPISVFKSDLFMYESWFYNIYLDISYPADK